jgi:three-Cys-motif partner protein
LDPDVDPYEGREHSKIKHRFLADYLQQASFKVLQGAGAANTFTYVDGFAGPWSVADEEDFSDSSFDYAVRVLLDTQKALQRIGAKPPKLRFLLCEKDPEAFKRLSGYAKKKHGLEINIFEGNFEDNLDEIRRHCHGFVFSFIDPKGWNLRSAEIAKFLAKIKGDFLLNFMEHPISRHNSYEGVRDSFSRLLDDDQWEQKIEENENSLPRELQILAMLKQRLKDHQAATYMPDFAILKPRVNRVQMRLVLGTRHVAGVDVFRTVEKKLQAEQMRTRRDLLGSSEAELSLFPPEILHEHELSEIGVGGRQNRRAATEVCKEIIGNASGPLKFDSLAARIMERIAVRTTDIKDIVVTLRGEGFLTFELPPHAKKPNDTTLIRRVI